MRFPLCVVFSILFTTHAWGDPSEKTLRYHQLLLKKPQPGTVLDRFVDAWLENDTPAELSSFLKQQSTRAEATAADHLVLALYLAHEGTDDVAALAAFEKATSLSPDQPQAWLERARLEARMLDFQRSLVSLDAALSRHPEPKMALDIAKLRGRTLLRLGRSKEALETWATLLKQNASDADMADELVDLQVEEGFYAEAVSQLTELITQSRDPYAQAIRRLRLGDIQLRMAKKQEALTAYAEALSQSSAGSWLEEESLSRIDSAYRREDDMKGLAEHLQTLGKAHAQRLTLQKAAATAMAELGDKDKAIALYQDLIQRSPGNRDMRESFLDLLERFEKYADAITQTQTLIEQNPRDRELQLRLAGLQHKAGDKKGSAAALASFLSAQGTDEFDHLRVATLLDQWNRTDEARESFAKVIAAWPKSFEVRDAHAQFLHRNGDKDSALKVWRELAAGAARDELLAIAIGLIARQESQTAFDLLSGRVAEFGHEPQFLAPLCQAALAVKQAPAAVPWVRSRVQLTDESTGLPDALNQAVAVLREADAVESTLRELRDNSKISVSERCLLSALLAAQGDLVGSEKVLQGAQKPEEALALQTQLIRLFMSRQEFARAAAATETLIAMPGGRSAQNAQRRVDLLNRAGDVEGAIKAVELWKQLAPATAQPFLSESQLLRISGKSDIALSVLRSAVRKFEDDEGLAAALADTYAEVAQYAQTERIYLRLYEDAQEQTAKLRWIKALSDAALLRGEVSGLVSRFRERQASNRADAIPWLALATIYDTAERPTDELAALQEAARLRPTDVSIATQIARLQEENGDWQQAMKTMERVAAQDRTDRVRTSMALMELRNGSQDKAFQVLADIAGGEKIDPRDAETIADAMAASGDWDRVISFLTPVVTRHPKDYRIGYQHAVALEEDGQVQAAREAFMRVLAIRDELTGFPKQKKPAQAAWEQTYSLYPPGVLQIMSVQSAIWQSYRYLQQRSQVSGSLRNNFLLLPDGLIESQAYAGAHLVKLVQELTAAEREGLVQPLKDIGFEAAPLVAYFEQQGQSGGWTLPDGILKRFPTDALLHAVWYPSESQNPEIALLARQAFNLLKDSYPPVAIAKALIGVAADPDSAGDLLAEALALAKEAPHKPGVRGDYVWQVQSLLGAQQNILEGTPSTLPEAMQQSLQELIVDSYRKGDIESEGQAEGLMQVMHALYQRKAWSDLVTLLDQDIARYRANPKAMKLAESALRLPLSGSASGGSSPQPLMFPPPGYMPQHVACCLAFPDPYNPESYGGMQPLDVEDAAGLLAVMDRVADPHLRVFLLWWAGDGKRAQAEVDAMFARPDVTAEACMLGAALAQRMEDAPRALALVTRASALPLATGQRKALDTALISMLTDADTVPAAVLEPARLAVRRMRSLAGADMETLAVLMEKLSIPDEAKRLRAQSASQPRSRGTGYASYSGGRASHSRVEQLIQNGNEEGAVREWLNVELAQFRNYYFQYNLSYALGQAKYQIDNRKQLIPHALKWLESNARNSIQKRLEYAAWLDMLGDKEKARETFATLLPQLPKNLLVRARLICLTMEKDKAKGARLLEETAPESLLDLMHGSLYQLIRDSLKPEERNALIAVFAKLADQWATQGRPLSKGLVTLYQHLPELARHRLSNVSGRTIPEMDLRTGSPSKDDDLPAVKERRKVHDELCHAMLKHPAVAQVAFASLTLTKDQAALLPLARSLLPPGSDRQLGAFSSQMRTSVYDGALRLWLPQPAQYLIREAALRGDLAALDADLLPLARSSLRGRDLAAVEGYARLWLCPEAEFGAATADYFKHSLDPNDHYQWMSADVCVPVDVLEARKFKTSLSDVVAKAAVKGQSWSLTSVAVRYLLHLDKQGDPVETMAFVDRLAEAMLGPPSGRDAKIKQFVKGYWGSGGVSNRGFYLMNELVNRTMREAATLPLSLAVAERIGFTRDATWQTNMMRNVQLSSLADDPAALLTLLKSSPFLKEAKEFDAWPRIGTTAILSSSFVSVDRGKSPAEVLKSVRESLLKMQPRTFGLDLCTALAVESKDRVGSLSAFIKKRAADFASIPAPRQAGLTQVLKEFMPGLKTPATLDPALLKALEPLMGAEIAAQNKRADIILSAKSLEEVNANDYTVYQELPLLLGELVKTDRNKAKALFLKAIGLIETKAAREGFNPAYAVGGWTFRSLLLGEFVKQGRTIEATAFAHRLLMEDDSGQLIRIRGSEAGNWGTSLMDTFRSAGGMGNVGRGLKGMLDRLQKSMDGAGPEALSAAFYDFAGKLPPSLRMPALKWCVKKEHPFAPELDAALRLHITTDNVTRKNSGMLKDLQELGGTAPMWEHYKGLVLSDKLSPQVRIAVASDVLKREWRGVPVELVRTAASLVAQENAALHACSGGSHMRWIMRAFCALPLDEQWKADAAKQWEAWLIRNARNSEDENFGRAYKPDDESSAGLLAMVSRLGKTEWIEKVLRDTENSQINEPSAFAMLVQGGQHALAVKWLERWGLKFLYNFNEELLWNHTLAEELPKFIAACPKPDLALYGEAVLARMPDHPQPEPSLKSKKDRMLAVAQKFKTTTFTDAVVRDRCVDYFAQFNELHELMADEYAARLKNIDVQKLISIPDTWKSYLECGPISAALGQQVWKGNAQPALDLLPKLIAAVPPEDGRNDFPYWNLGYVFGSPIFDTNWRWERGKSFDPAALIKLCEALAVQLPQRPSINNTQSVNIASRATCILMILRAVQGDMTPFETWRKGLTDDQRKMIQASIKAQNHLLLQCASYFGKPKYVVPADQRVRALGLLLNDPWIKPLYPEAGLNLPNLCNLILTQQKLFTPEEFATAAPALAQALPRNGRTAGEAADMLVQQGRVADAPALYDLAISQLASKDVNAQAPFIFRKAEALERLNQKPEAIGALNTVDQPKLSPSNRNVLTTALKRLGAPAPTL